MGREQDIDTVLSEIRLTMVTAGRQARRSKTLGSDKLASLAKLGNAFARVISVSQSGKATQQDLDDLLENGNTEFYDAINSAE